MTPSPIVWMRKTVDELDSECHRPWLAFGGPAAVSFLAFIGSFVMGLVGPRNYYGTQAGATNPPTTWGEALATSALRALVMAIAAFPCPYVYQLLAGRRLFSISSKVEICNKCYRVKSSDGEEACSCGGRFEDFDLWKWVDD